MEIFEALLLRVLTVSAGCSAVLVPVLLLAPRLQRRVAARSFYVVFLLLALRLAVPVEIPLPAPAVRLSVPDYTVAVPAPRPAAVEGQPAPVGTPAASLPVQAAPVEKPADPAPAVREVPVTAILGMVWAAGALGCALWAAGSFLLARRRLLSGARPAGAEETALLDALRRELGVRRPVRLCRSALSPGPLALGLLCPVIVLPAGSGAQGLELILRHELTHIRRWDVAYKLVLSLACAVNWFNPLVWRMDRAAGRSLELCCDDEVARGLSEAERKEYGRVLLSAAGAARPLPFTTCFSDGKEQMMGRLLNLFTRKKNSAALICLALAAALLAGGLVACEQASGSVTGSGAENDARRALYETYFYENYKEDAASVVLADLTGDGLDELVVLSLDANSPYRWEELTEDNFSFGQVECFSVADGAVTQVLGPDDMMVGSAHVGWGYTYLVPRTDGKGCALLNFRPWFGQGYGSYSFELFAFDDSGEQVTLDSGFVEFLAYSEATVKLETEATREEIRAMRDTVNRYQTSGVPLLVYYDDVIYIDVDVGNVIQDFACLKLPPEDAFAGKGETLSELRERVTVSYGLVSLIQPAPIPSTAEEALDVLEENISISEQGVIRVFVPDYDGTWEIEIVAKTILGWRGGGPDGEDEPIYGVLRYGEEMNWTPGKMSGVWPRLGYVVDLTVEARVTAPDGTVTERTIPLLYEEYTPGMALPWLEEDGE